MKYFFEIIQEQKQFCTKLYDQAMNLANDFISNKNINAILLTGSVARGDARIGPFGLYTDLLFIVDENCNIEQIKTFLGPDQEPEIPFHCIKIDDVGYQVNFIETKKFLQLPKSENEAFSISESQILLCNFSDIGNFIESNFKQISDNPRKEIAVDRFHKFRYFTNQYRIEKWLYRKAYYQISHNFYIAFISFVDFLYAINGKFIPRDDWKIYLLFELKKKPANIEGIISLFQQDCYNESKIAKLEKQCHECIRWMGNEINFFTET